MRKRCGIVLLPLLLCLSLSACDRGPKPAFEGSGTLEAVEILLSAKTAGTVVRVAVQEGDTVSAGQAVAQVETEKAELQERQLAAGLEELRLNLRNAERAAALAAETHAAAARKFERLKSLREGESVSQQAFEDAETAFRAAKTADENAATSLLALRARQAQLEAQIGLAESQIRDASVTSPIGGTVLTLYVDEGEVARPGGPVASVADVSRMWIKVYAKAAELGRIRLSGAAELRVDADPDRPHAGRVSWISPKAEFTPKMVQTRDARSDLVYAVKIEVDNPDGALKIGMPADVVIP